MKTFKAQFGGTVTKARQQKYSNSHHWKEGKLENLEETTMDLNFHTLPKLLYKQFFESKGREPKNSLPIVPYSDDFQKPTEKAQFIWYGHSVILLKIADTTILIDPMFGSNASPIAPFPTKRFSNDALQVIDDLPDIDVLLMTHDHYDHLDLKSMKKLKSKVKAYHVAMGVGRHLEEWGITPNVISEYDWWDDFTINDIHITFTPTRHFSGRGLRDRAKSLWGGWSFKHTNEHIWFSGDGGYGHHFKEIHKRLGDVDVAFMECGQYNPNWHQIHMYPEESVQACLDVRTKQALPVHWGGFSLAQHSWKEPVERFTAEANKKNVSVLTPQIGALTTALSETTRWWENLE